MNGIGGQHIVEHAKIVHYLLNPDHPTGKSKAAFFQAFGFDRLTPAILAEALEGHARRRPVVRTVISAFGIKRELRCHLKTPDGRDPCIVAIWLQVADGGSHRFITAYPAPRDKGD